MNIGFDIDYTISNPLKSQDKIVMDYLAEHGIEPVLVDPTRFGLLERYGLSKKEDREFWDKVGIDVLCGSEPMPYAVETLKRLKDDGHTISLITARGTSEMLSKNPYVYSYLWLKKHGFVFDKIICRDPDKADACEQLGVDVFVDDNIKVLRKLENICSGTILMTAPHNLHFDDKDLPSNCKRVHNFNEVYEIISNLENEKVC